MKFFKVPKPQESNAQYAGHATKTRKMKKPLPPLTEEDIEAPDFIAKRLSANKMTLDWWLKEKKRLTKFKADVELKNGGIGELETVGAGRIQNDALNTVAEVAGWKRDKVEHSGTIVFESNVPEPDALPEEQEK